MVMDRLAILFVCFSLFLFCTPLFISQNVSAGATWQQTNNFNVTVDVNSRTLEQTNNFNITVNVSMPTLEQTNNFNITVNVSMPTLEQTNNFNVTVNVSVPTWQQTNNFNVTVDVNSRTLEQTNNFNVTVDVVLEVPVGYFHMGFNHSLDLIELKNYSRPTYTLHVYTYYFNSTSYSDEYNITFYNWKFSDGFVSGRNISRKFAINWDEVNGSSVEIPFVHSVENETTGYKASLPGTLTITMEAEDEGEQITIPTELLLTLMGVIIVIVLAVVFLNMAEGLMKRKVFK